MVVLLIGIRDIAGVNINKYIFLAIISISVFAFLNVNFIIALFCFLIPLLAGLPGNYIIIVLCISLMLKGNMVFKQSTVILIILFLIVESFNIILHNAFFFELAMYSIFFLFVLVVLSIKNNIDLHFCIISFSIGTFLALSIILMGTIKYVSFSALLLSSYRYGNILDLTVINKMLLTHDQNYIGYLAIVGISSLILLLSTEKMKRKKLVKLICVFLVTSLTFYGMLTLSRAFIIAFIIHLLMYLMFNAKVSTKGLKKSLIFLIYITLLGMAINTFFPEIINNIINRFMYEEISGGRLQINAYYINLFFDNIKVFLIGTGVLPMLVEADYPFVIHNASLQILIGSGVIGSFVFIFWVVSIVKGELRKVSSKVKMKSLIPLIVTLVIVQSIPFLNPYYGILPMLIPIFAFRLNDELI